MNEAQFLLHLGRDVPVKKPRLAAPAVKLGPPEYLVWDSEMDGYVNVGPTKDEWK